MEYKYKPLNPRDNTQEIRLLHLHPAASIDIPLRGLLAVSTLKGAHRTYEALSYTWGDAVSRHPLLLEDQCLQIGQNLDDALRRLRYKDRPRTLWVDAICINQRDDTEKTTQIAMMGQIYAFAEQVVVWLGEDSEQEDGRLFMTLATALAKISNPGPSWMKLRWYWFLKFCFGLPWDPQGSFDFCNNFLLEKSQNRTDAHAVTKLFLNRSWFSRRWVIQELVLSRKATMICGINTMDMDVLSSVIQHYLSGFNQRIGDLLTNDESHARQLLRAFSVREERTATGTTASGHFASMSSDVGEEDEADIREILRLVHRFETFQCRDPRDIIAALLSMRTGTLPKLALDYTFSTEQNYINLATSLISNGLCLHMLLEATGRVRSTEQSIRPLPSWVPDWRLPTRSSYWDGNQPAWFECEAPSDYPECIVPKFETFTSGEHIVTLPFVVIDTIVATPYPNQHYTLNDLILHDNRSKVELETASQEFIIGLGDLVCFLGTDASMAFERYEKKRFQIDRACFILRKQGARPTQISGQNADSYSLVHSCNTYSSQAWKQENISTLKPFCQWLRLI